MAVLSCLFLSIVLALYCRAWHEKNTIDTRPQKVDWEVWQRPGIDGYDLLHGCFEYKPLLPTENHLFVCGY
jgi:hypothetical protein